jgi:hypothetical protein
MQRMKRIVVELLACLLLVEVAMAAFRPGTQWVVRVQNADAGMSNYPLPVVGNTARLPWWHINYDVEGPGPNVVNLDALRGMARSQQLP